MASSAQELDALASALNRSAERLQTLWFSFLALTLYFAISALTTTHRMLFLEESQILPILNVKLPLLPFYVIAPAFYVVLHAYMLMMLVLLARTARTFESTLAAAGSLAMTDKDSERYRMRMENAIFLQIIAGARRERSGANGRVLRAIALLSLAVAPVLVLLLFQLMFLPYHSEWITWWHRGLVLVDLVLIWTLWSSYRQHGGERMLPTLRPWPALAAKSVASLAVIAFSVLLATFPHEWMFENAPLSASSTPMRILFGEPETSWFSDRTGVFSNRLWLPNEDFVDDDKLKRISAENRLGDKERPSFILDLSNRNLAGANLTNADLRRVNFSGYASNLRGTVLTGAWLQGASFDKAKMQEVQLHGALLQGASFEAADLQGGGLYGAELSGAKLGTEMQGAFLAFARLTGADLTGANLQGAVLDWAELQGATLRSASLEGASLRCAQLQGADLEGARMQGSWLGQIHTWRIRGRPDRSWPALFDRPRDDAQPFVEYDEADRLHAVMGGKPNECSTVAKLLFPEWLDRILKGVPEGSVQSGVREKLATLGPSPSDSELHQKEEYWHMVAATQPAGDAFQDEMAKILEETACSEYSTRHFADGIIRNGLLETVAGRHLSRFGELFDEARRSRPGDKIACPGAAGLTEEAFNRFCFRFGKAKLPVCAGRQSME